MGKLRIPHMISDLTDAMRHAGLPRNEKDSLFSMVTGGYSALPSSEDCGRDADTDIGYESSWSEIFQATNGAAYIKRQQTNK